MENTRIRILALTVVKTAALVKQKHQELSLWEHPKNWESPGIRHAAEKVQLLQSDLCAAKAEWRHATIALTVELCEGNVSPSPERESVSIDISDSSSLVCGWWEDGTGYEMQLTLRL